ncbi:MAG: TldD/PmbA family protein [Brevinema sp.]
MINRIYQYEEQLKQSINDATECINKGDIFGQISYSQSVDFDHDKLQSIDDVSYSSISCRLFEQGRVGNAGVNHPQHIPQMLDNAQESVLFGEYLDIDLPAEHIYPKIDWLYTEKNINYDKQELKAISEDLLAKIKVFAPKAKVSSGAGNSCSHVFLANTEGFRGEYQTSSLTVQGGLFELLEDGSFLELYESETFYDDDCNLHGMIDRLQERVEHSRQSSFLKKEGTMPVIIAPSAMDMILSPIELAVNGKILYKNLSLFVDRLNEQIVDPKFTLIDDPFYYHGSATAPFDDEGVIGKPIPIIENGILKNFIYDCTTAKKMNTKTTGHASRSSLSLPSPELSNRIIGLGEYSLQEMISSLDYGLMLVTPLGEGQSNVLAGDFSVLAETAYLIEHGQLKGRVKDIMLSGNIFDLLKNISMIENRHHKEYGLFTPHLLIDAIKITKNH